MPQTFQEHNNQQSGMPSLWLWYAFFPLPACFLNIFWNWSHQDKWWAWPDLNIFLVYEMNKSWPSHSCFVLSSTNYLHLVWILIILPTIMVMLNPIPHLLGHRDQTSRFEAPWQYYWPIFIKIGLSEWQCQWPLKEFDPILKIDRFMIGKGNFSKMRFWMMAIVQSIWKILTHLFFCKTRNFYSRKTILKQFGWDKCLKICRVNMTPPPWIIGLRSGVPFLWS